MNRRWVKNVLLFIAMLLVMPGLMVLRKENSDDRVYKNVWLGRGGTIGCTVDLGNQGALKSLFNPNIISLHLRLRVEEGTQLRCLGSGMTMMVSQGTKKGLWLKMDERTILQKKRGSIPLNVEIYVPKDAWQRYHAADGKIDFYDGEILYGTVAIEVINSRL